MTDKTIPVWKKELLLALVLLAVGLLLLPLGVYLAGREIAGDYAGEGLWGLFRHILADLGRGQMAAWLLLLSPYLTVQLSRLGVACFRQKGSVTQVTIHEESQ